MGSATNRPDQHRRYDAEYKLNDAEGIRILLRDYDKLFQRRFEGDTAASDILLDLEDAIDAAEPNSASERGYTPYLYGRFNATNGG